MHFSTLFLFSSAISGLYATALPEPNLVYENPHNLTKRFWPDPYCDALAKPNNPDFGVSFVPGEGKGNGDYDKTIPWPEGRLAGPSEAEWEYLVKEVKERWAMYKAGKTDDWRGRWCKQQLAICMIVQPPMAWHEGPTTQYGYINTAKLNEEGDELRFYRYWESTVTFRARHVDASVQVYFAHGFTWICTEAPYKITFMNYKRDLELYKKGLHGNSALAKTLESGCRCHFPVTDDFIIWM